MNHRDTDYLYISTRLKARSQNLFSREKLNRLIAAKTAGPTLLRTIFLPARRKSRGSSRNPSSCSTVTPPTGG